MTTVAIQGYEASFHDVAARQLLGDDIVLICCDTFLSVFTTVSEGRAEYGVVAVSNSIYGPIHDSVKLFDMHQVDIEAQTTVAVEQCLLTVPGAQLSDVREVYSHPVALAQCKTYLSAYLPDALLISHADTAGAAKDVATWNDPAKAAIASQAAAKRYGLTVHAANIQSEKNNVTTFVLFARR
ncbi:MAG TPA: prephenate dehydratase domain-containing protein [Candidatus Saccharimonadales bacterium]|nr:prephenate dehydratase domain-containing protein [Candidatus Saccharimonadales bacterium]